MVSMRKNACDEPIFGFNSPENGMQLIVRYGWCKLKISPFCNRPQCTKYGDDQFRFYLEY